MKKPTLLQRYIAKKIGIKQDTTINQNALTKQSKGDSLAKTGLIYIVAGVSSLTIFIVSALASSGTILFVILALLGDIMLLIGLIHCLVALTQNNITPKGKKNAKTGLLLLAAFVLLYAILILLLRI
jgi:hypothetical protein